MENYKEDINLDLIENKFYINKYEVSRNFKKITGYNFKTYLILVRLSKAKDLLEKDALYEIFSNNFDTKIDNVRERFQVSSLTKKVAEALNLKDGSAALKITRFSYDKEDKLIEYTTSYARGDMFYYETSYSPN